MATTWMHSDAAVGEESQPRVPGLSMRKQNQSGNCTVAVPGVWLSRFWPDDRQVFVQLPGICWVFFIDWSSFPCHRHTRDRVSSLLCRLATGCAAHPAAHPPSPHGRAGPGAQGHAHSCIPSIPTPGSQVSRGHVWLDQNHPLDLGKVRGLLIGSSQEIFGRSNPILPFLWVPVFHYSLTQKGSEDKQNCGLRAAAVVIYLGDLELNLGGTTPRRWCVALGGGGG